MALLEKSEKRKVIAIEAKSKVEMSKQEIKKDTQLLDLQHKEKDAKNQKAVEKLKAREIKREMAVKKAERSEKRMVNERSRKIGRLKKREKKTKVKQKKSRQRGKDNKE